MKRQSEIPNPYQEKKQREMQKTFPHDLIIEILLKLPTKSLIRCKSLSKTWLYHISSLAFAKLHLKRLCKEPSLRTHKLLLSTTPNLKSLDCEASCDGDNLGDIIDFPLKRAGSRVTILGSCHGMICLALDRHANFFLWNPATGDYSPLPDPGITPDGFSYVYGFGYDESIHDYKVIVATCLENISTLKVLRLRDNFWRPRIEDVPHVHAHVVCQNQSGYLVNGALHWLARRSTHGDFQAIISFDLAKERFRQVPMPDNVTREGDAVHFNSFGVLGSRLFLIGNTDKDLMVTMWVMRYYGVKDWGTRVLGSYQELNDYECVLVPLFFTRSRQIIFLDDRAMLIWFNLEETTIMTSWVCDDWDICEAVVYVETLISPTTLNQIEI